MSLQSTGTISFGNINVELGLSATAKISLNDAAVRTLAGTPSGAINLYSFFGKSNAGFSASISSNQKELNLRTLEYIMEYHLLMVKSIIVIGLKLLQNMVIEKCFWIPSGHTHLNKLG